MTDLKTEIKDVSPIRKTITVEVPVERVKKVLEDEYKKIGKRAKIKGFRKGKVPRNILEKYYSEDVVREAVNSIVRETYPEALEKEMASPISAPYVEPGPFDKAKPFSYSATFEVRPMVEVKEYAGLKAEKPEISVTEEEVMQQLGVIQQQMAQLEPVPDGTKANQGMVIIIDFSGTVDGKPFKGSQATDFMVELGAGNLLPAIDAALIGLTTGDEKDFEIDYPADYFNKELAGKKGGFHIKVKSIKRKIVPDIDDEFAKDLGYKTLDEVKKDVEGRILAMKKQEAKRIVSEQILEQLVERHPFEVPESMINNELKVMFEGLMRQLYAQNKKLEDIGVTIEQFIENNKRYAEKRVRSFLIIDAIAELEKVGVSDDELEERLKVISQQLNQPLPKVKQQYESQNLISGLRLQLKHEKTLDLIIEKAKIKVKKAKKTENSSKQTKNN